jgi:hypothetical protein
MSSRAVFFLLCLFVALQPARLDAAQIELSVADVISPSFSATGIVVTLLQHGAADLRIAALSVSEKKWEKLHLHCAEFLLSSQKVVCRDGKLDATPALPFNFSYDFDTQKAELALAAKGQEVWKIQAEFQSRLWSVNAILHQAQASRLAALLPEGMPLPTKGLLEGRLALHGNKQGITDAHAALQIDKAAFSDASGLHAGENFQASMQLDATHTAQIWNSRITLDWQSGELFWQPLYLHGGHALQAEIEWDGKQITITHAVAEINGVGKLGLDAQWDVANKQLIEASLSGSKLGLARLFSDYAKPFFGEGAMAESEMSGTADLSWQYSNGATQLLSLQIQDAALTNDKKRFALRGLNADIPWSPGQITQAHLAFASGALWGMPLGASRVDMAMHGLDFTIPDATLPVLDGKLSIHDFHLQHEQGAWRWEFSGGLTPLSMPPLSAALGWPEMQGTLSGMIPHVSYQDKILTVDGALLFRIFDGTIVVSSLKLDDPFGPAPHLFGNLDMRELDLGALTQAFSFGNVQGRIDVGVKGLELVNWLPVRFDAKVASSPGSYRKKISQKAVQNISALGGAGAAAAVQRSVMRIFENFGYSRIILSCVLRDGVCAMDGERSEGNSYFIVKGGGIPAINVMGYNHEVDWDELLNRLKRVIKNNAKAVVQ